ncbi:hypothetical protein NFI96_006847 [Xyrichtys novacula]|uniref:Uncharacterized protein n=1 Tax=Xyrichtys novacula TaxID=13765 RepID=A0AAV1G0J5_XYRNO|nr:hypothetical protein NFI96_006847 [Xyrichtys novacula]
MPNTKESSQGDPLRDIHPVLANLTSQLIPQYMTKIQKAKPSNPEDEMADLLETALTTTLRDKELTRRMSVVMSSQLEYKDYLLECALAKIKTQKEENSALKKTLEETKKSLSVLEKHSARCEASKLPSLISHEENLDLKDKIERLNETLYKKEKELDDTNNQLAKTTEDLIQSESLLEQATEDVKALKALVKVRAEALEVKEKQTSTLRHQLHIAQRQLILCQERQEEIGKELEDDQRELQCSLQSGRAQRERMEQTFLEEMIGDQPPERAPSLPSKPTLKYISQHHDRTLLDPERSSLNQESYSPPHDGFLPSPSDRDLDKIARNLARFEPEHQGAIDTCTYLKDIDFYLRKCPGATVDDKIYLIKATSSREVSSFLERQPYHVRNNYDLLCQALIEEFSDYLTQTGLSAALSIKQGRSEPPQHYYNRLREAYFGFRNEPEMEEDLNFKTLFVQNLHPTTSHHLGVLACPNTSTSRQLRELAVKGFAKQRQTLAKKAEPVTLLAMETKSLPMELNEASDCVFSGSDKPPNEWLTRPPKPFRPQQTHKGQSYTPRPRSDPDQCQVNFETNCCYSDSRHGGFYPRQRKNHQHRQRGVNDWQNQSKSHSQKRRSYYPPQSVSSTSKVNKHDNSANH